MLVEVGKPLLDLAGLRENAAVDDVVVVIRKMHHAREILPELHRIDDGEAEFAGGRGGDEAEHDVVQRFHHRLVAGLGGLKKNRALLRVSEQQRQ